MRELIYISLLAGFCSGLAAALDRKRIKNRIAVLCCCVAKDGGSKPSP
jgi:hypothetical protein